MNQEQHSFSTSKKAPPLEIDLDEFMISEDSFKPMTKGLGFHQDLKRPSFKPSPKEVKPFGATKKPIMHSAVAGNTNNLAPTGLEAFYGQASVSNTVAPASTLDISEDTKTSAAAATKTRPAPLLAQFSAWIIDLLVIASCVAITGALLVVASGIELKMYSRLITFQDLTIFTGAIFSIYYLLYFTILDLSATPGKTLLDLRVVRNDGKPLSVKHTFTRAFVSLISGIALFLPLSLDFQGRLSDTKVVK